MKNRRVVITGIGAVTPLGDSLGATAAALSRGETAIRRVRSFDPTGCAEERGAELDSFDARPFFRVPKALKLCDRRTRLAVAAAAMAVDDSGLAVDSLSDSGVIVGTSGSDLLLDDLARAIGPDEAARAVEDIPWFASRILSGVTPLWLIVTLPNMVSAHVAIQLRTCGPNNTVMTDWIAGLQALGEAARLIESGEADSVIAGGAEAAVLPFVFASYSQSDLFDRTDAEDGFVLGDGAAMFVLEERSKAIERGARIKGEIQGYASSSGELAASLSSSIGRALQEASFPSVDAFAGPSVFTPRFREAEKRAFSTLNMGTHVSYRRQLGHSLAAAGPIDLALLCADDVGRRAAVASLGFTGQSAALAVTTGGAS